MIDASNYLRDGRSSPSIQLIPVHHPSTARSGHTNVAPSELIWENCKIKEGKKEGKKTHVKSSTTITRGQDTEEGSHYFTASNMDLGAYAAHKYRPTTRTILSVSGDEGCSVY